MLVWEEGIEDVKQKLDQAVYRGVSCPYPQMFPCHSPPHTPTQRAKLTKSILHSELKPSQCVAKPAQWGCSMHVVGSCLCSFGGFRTLHLSLKQYFVPAIQNVCCIRSGGDGLLYCLASTLSDLMVLLSVLGSRTSFMKRYKSFVSSCRFLRTYL